MVSELFNYYNAQLIVFLCRQASHYQTSDDLNCKRPLELLWKQCTIFECQYLQSLVSASTKSMCLKNYKQLVEISLTFKGWCKCKCKCNEAIRGPKKRNFHLEYLRKMGNDLRITYVCMNKFGNNRDTPRTWKWRN